MAELTRQIKSYRNHCQHPFDEIFHKDKVKFKGHQNGVASNIYKNRKRREKVRELYLLKVL